MRIEGVIDERMYIICTIDVIVPQSPRGHGTHLLPSWFQFSQLARMYTALPCRPKKYRGVPSQQPAMVRPSAVLPHQRPPSAPGKINNPALRHSTTRYSVVCHARRSATSDITQITIIRPAYHRLWVHLCGESMTLNTPCSCKKKQAYPSHLPFPQTLSLRAAAQRLPCMYVQYVPRTGLLQASSSAMRPRRRCRHSADEPTCAHDAKLFLVGGGALPTLGGADCTRHEGAPATRLAIWQHGPLCAGEFLRGVGFCRPSCSVET